MAMFSQDDLNRLAQELDAVPIKFDALIARLTARHYSTERAVELALHGFGRRLETLKSSLLIVFRAIPTTLEGLPTYENLQLATVALQANVINVFGAIDDLAGLWVEERGVRKPNGQPLSDGQIGLGTGGRYDIVRDSFTAEFRAYLDGLAEWFDVMERFRHAVAHRIPLFLHPYAVEPEDKDEHDALDAQIAEAAQNHDFDRANSLSERQVSLRFFQPVMRHSILEGAPLLAIHPQLLADFNTVEDIALKLLEELDGPAP